MSENPTFTAEPMKDTPDGPISVDQAAKLDAMSPIQLHNLLYSMPGIAWYALDALARKTARGERFLANVEQFLLGEEETVSLNVKDVPILKTYMYVNVTGLKQLGEGRVANFYNAQKVSNKYAGAVVNPGVSISEGGHYIILRNKVIYGALPAGERAMEKWKHFSNKFLLAQKTYKELQDAAE